MPILVIIPIILKILPLGVVVVEAGGGGHGGGEAKVDVAAGEISEVRISV